MEIDMKTYENAIDWIATSMFHAQMGGGSYRHGMSGVFPIAFVYGVTTAQVETDAYDAYSVMVRIAAKEGIDNV
jgi:hypothetical protein